MDKLGKSICFKIKYKRIEEGLSILDLSHITGIPYSCLCGYERCNSIPRSDKLIKICRALDINIWDF